MTDTPHLETLALEPAGPADASVIWMHGLGADANDFYGLAPQLGLPAELRVRFVFPNAPRIPVTINGGLIMRAWYDVYGFDARDQDEPRIRRSAGWIDELVAREAGRGVPARRVVLAGFSQGGAMALFAGLRHAERLAGLMCLSAYLPLPDALAAEASAANRAVPIFQAHGSADPMVSAVAGPRLPGPPDRGRLRGRLPRVPNGARGLPRRGARHRRVAERRAGRFLSPRRVYAEGGYGGQGS